MRSPEHAPDRYRLLHLCVPALALILFLAGRTVAQDEAAATSWFPHGSTFTPLIANHEEPRMGIAQEIGTSRMKVAIGNALDILGWTHGSDTLRLSGLFFAYALANDHRGYRLKIDAADGFFGLGFTWTNATPWSFRFRILHLSAHFVDGHYHDEYGMWRDGVVPFPFSRNYGEAVAAYGLRPAGWTVRLYGGITYAPIVKPTVIRKWTLMAGWEAHTPGTTHLYAAQHFQAMGTPVVIGSTAIEAGVKFGAPAGRGARLFLAWQNGWDNFGMYYNVRREAVSAGFAFDFL